MRIFALTAVWHCVIRRHPHYTAAAAAAAAIAASSVARRRATLRPDARTSIVARDGLYLASLGT